MKFVLIIILAFIVPSTAYAHEIIFSDDFNRVDNDDVGNDWAQSERESNDVAARINNNAMTFYGLQSQASRPCVSHEFIVPPSAELLQINFTYNFRPLTTLDEKYNVQVRLGEGMTCNTTDPSLVARLFHTDDSKTNISLNGSFGHYVSGTRIHGGVVDGLIDVSILINNINSFFSYNVTGAGLQGNDIDVKNVPFINNLSVNSTVFKLNRVDGQADGTFLNTVIIDNFKVTRIDAVLPTCGISVDTVHGFGTLKPDENSNEIPIEFIGNGATDSLVSVSVTDWLDSERFTKNLNDGENTHFSTLENIPYDEKTAVITNDFVEIETVPHHGSLMTYWETKLILKDETYEGNAKQIMTFGVLCN